jgi:hypothetical protein
MVRSAVAVLAALAFTAGLAAAEPRGPAFGRNAVRGEIRDDGEPDADDFVGPLLAGETLSVSVRADGDGALLPGLRVLAPTGADRTPALRIDGGGARCGFRRLVADRTGRWVVRVSGRDDSEGGYLVRFRVGRAQRAPVRAALGGDAPAVASVPFEAVRGATLDLRLGPVPPSPLPRLLALLDPEGREVPALSGLLDRRGRDEQFRALALDGDDGTWRAVVGTDAGERPRLALRVRPPERPRGVSALDPSDPRLDRRESPVAGLAGERVRLTGRGFSEAPPPVVLVGDRPAAVLAVGPGGLYLDVILPPAAPGTTASAAVVNPDGQSCEQPRAVLYLAPGPPAVRAFSPEVLTLAAGSNAPVTVLLSGTAPPGGIDVALALEGAVGSVPPTVRVEPWASEATFEFAAGKAAGEGVLSATLGAAVSLAVKVTPPPPPGFLDLSRWTLVQTDSPRSFVLPEGTRLRTGGTLVVARNATRAAFEAFWHVTLGADVVYLDSGDRFPSLNGDETISLLDPGGGLAEGPTLRLVAGKGYQRVPGAPPGPDPSWLVSAAAPDLATPGRMPDGTPSGVWITEFADPAGTGNFVHEFVEVGWGGP